MVGNTYHQQMLPKRSALEAVDEYTEAVIGVSHGVGTLIQALTMIRHLPGFVTRQCKQSRKTRCRLRTKQTMIQRIKYDMIGNAPRMGFTHGQREMRVAQDGLIAGREQIALHIRKIDVASIEKLGVVTGLAQTSRQGRQATRFFRQFHHGYRGKCRITTQG